MKNIILIGLLGKNYKSFSDILQRAKLSLDSNNNYMISENDDLKPLFLEYAEEKKLQLEVWPEYTSHGNQNFLITYVEMVRKADSGILIYDNISNQRIIQFQIVASAWRLPFTKYKI